MLGAGLEQTIAIERAQQLGYYVVAMDGNPAAPGLERADRSTVGDIRDIGLVETVARENGVCGVFAHGVEIPVVVAEVARRLELPGLSPDVAKTCTDKHLRSQVLSKAGIRVPRSQHILSGESGMDSLTPVALPAVVKPCDNSGSRGVQLIHRSEEIGAAVALAKEYSQDGCVTVEEFIAGPQVSTEAFVDGDNVVIFGFADRNYSGNERFFPFFVENGVDMPSILSTDEVGAAHDAVTKAIKALGITFGSAKGDLILSELGPVILEMASRTSGGWFLAGSVPASTGVDAFDVLLPQSVGDPFDFSSLVPKRFDYVAQRYWIPTRDGILTEVEGLALAEQSPGVVKFDSFFPPIGSQIRKSTNHAERYAQVITRGDSRFEAAELADQAISMIRVSLQ